MVTNQLNPPPAITPPIAPLVNPHKYELKGWLAKYLLFPLSPFFIGLFLRFVNFHSLVFKSIYMSNAEGLAFSLIMFCLLGSITARRLDDKGVQSFLYNTFIIGVIIFSALFAISTWLSIDVVNNEQKALLNLTNFINGSQTSTYTIQIGAFAQERLDGSMELSHILIATFILGVVFIGMGVLYRQFYGLGED
jgi:hypothetical protein